MPNEPERGKLKGWLAVVPTIIAAIGGLIAIPVSFIRCHNANVAQSFSIIGAIGQWQNLLNGYYDVDQQIQDYEMSQGMKRDGPEIKTLSELNESLSNSQVPSRQGSLVQKTIRNIPKLTRCRRTI